MIPIGHVISPYQEKFAVPRQPGLAKSAIGYCELTGEAGHPDCVRGLEQFSHIWILFQFHQTQAQGWKPLVRPPRLGGNEKVGVFASRSTFRPNAIGMSLVELLGIEQGKSEGKACVRLKVRGLDLVDGTPILDIKPYLPYAESVPEALAGYATDAPSSPLKVEFSSQVQVPSALKPLIKEVLQQDPRPAYQQGQFSEREYGVTLAHHNVRFRYVAADSILVTSVTPEPTSKIECLD